MWGLNFPQLNILDFHIGEALAAAVRKNHFPNFL
jgi:hypothetical protein